MNEELKKFIEDNKPNRGILDKYADEIMAMREADLSFKLIIEYLKTRHDVQTSIQNVSQWYKRKTAQKTQKNTTKKAENKEQNSMKNEEDFSLEELLKNKNVMASLANKEANTVKKQGDMFSSLVKK